MIRSSLVAVLALASGAALAQPWVPCECRYRGERFELGSVMCLADPNGGTMLARCDMSQNVTTWTVLGKSCPSARLKGGPVAHQSSTAG
ncbi:MAG: hypothetical protein JO048_16495 [Methylobacteriaceae bacterium]|nr:hypothetical protein [Methylobacteriaceae bacterium]